MTNPDTQLTWLNQQNVQKGYQLLPLIRVLKRWNVVHGKQFKSFHLGVVAANTFSSLNANRPDAVAKFFAWAPNWLDVVDPAGYSGALSSYLTSQQRLNLRTRLAHAAVRANNAIAAAQTGNHQEAIRLWRIELGNEFPAYG